MIKVAQNDINYFRILKPKIDQFWSNLQLPKAVANAQYEQISKMGQIICFYDNIHVLKSGQGQVILWYSNMANAHYTPEPCSNWERVEIFCSNGSD